MKRALTALAVGGLLAFAVPQGALAHPVGSETADHSGGHEATEPEGTAPEPEQGSPDRPYGDSEQHDDEEGTILF